MTLNFTLSLSHLVPPLSRLHLVPPLSRLHLVPPLSPLHLVPPLSRHSHNSETRRTAASMVSTAPRAVRRVHTSLSAKCRHRDFYRFYPQIVATLSPQFQKQLSASGICSDSVKVATPSPLSGRLILERLSYSQIELLAGMDNRLFVSKYQLGLPEPEALKRYLDEQRRMLENGNR